MLDVNVTTDPPKTSFRSSQVQKILSTVSTYLKLVKQGTVPPSLRSTFVVALQSRKMK